MSAPLNINSYKNALATTELPTFGSIKVPREIVALICSYLEKSRDVVQLALTSRSFCFLASNAKPIASLWSSFLSKDFSNSYTVPQSENENFALYKSLKNAIRNMKAGNYYLQTLNEHKDHINCMTTLNGQLISGSVDHTIKIWNLKTGQLIRTLIGHTAGVAGMTILDGQLISGSWDGTIKTWDSNTGQELQTLIGHQEPIICMTTLNGQLISGSEDTTIKIWDLKTGQLIQTLNGHESWIDSMTILDGQLISGSADRTIKIWDLSTGKELQTLIGHKARVGCMTILDGQLISGSADRTIKIWDLKTGQLIQTLIGHKHMVTCLIALNGQLISGSRDKTIRIWDLKTGQPIQTLEHQDPIECMTTLNGQLISGSEKSTIKIWDFNTRPFKEIAEENFPILLVDLGIVDSKMCSEKLECTPDFLLKAGICSAEDLQALYLQVLPKVEFPAFQCLQIIAEEATQDHVQLQTRAFNKKEIVFALLAQLLDAAQKKLDETTPYTVRHNHEGAVYHVLNPWATFQKKLTSIKDALNTETPKELVSKFSPESYAELVKEINALIDEFHTSCKREMQILVLHDYINQYGILKKWNNLRTQEGIHSLSALLKTDKAPQNIFYMGK